jgi:hypothetical protein
VEGGCYWSKNEIEMITTYLDQEQYLNEKKDRERELGWNENENRMKCYFVPFPKWFGVGTNLYSSCSFLGTPSILNRQNMLYTFEVICTVVVSCVL